MIVESRIQKESLQLSSTTRREKERLVFSLARFEVHVLLARGFLQQGRRRHVIINFHLSSSLDYFIVGSGTVKNGLTDD